MAGVTDHEHWLHEPEEHDYPAAADYLTLNLDPGVAETVVAALEKAPLVHRKAKDLLRASGLALLTKFSMIVLIPVLACLALGGIVFARRLRIARRQVMLHGGIVLVLVLLMINAAYRFQGPPIVRGCAAYTRTRCGPRRV